MDEADARVKAYEKSMEISRLSHEFTRVTSPIDGQISRYYLTLGNLVNQDQTLLTTVVSVDPMYVFFDMDEPTLLRTRKAVNEGRIKLPEQGHEVPVLMGMQGEDGYPHEGTINFVNNQVNPTTGSILVRGVFPNPCPKGATGCCRRACSSGSGCRSANPIRPCWSSIAPSARTRGTSMSTCSTRKTRLQYRRVTTGPLQDDGLRVIEQGLKPDDLVVVGALAAGPAGG